jgi:large subunit ribosomal protein L7/L12
MTMSDLTKDQVKEFLSKLTVVELADLVKELEEDWGVSAAAPVAIAAGPAAGGEAAVEEAPTEFTPTLIDFGDKKIQVIKEVRAITGLGLKEAKELVEGVPTAIKERVTQDEANEIKEKIEAAGGSVDVKAS